MDYRGSLRQLERLFLENDYQGHLANKREHVVSIPVETCANGSQISISFPGYKATPDKPDYRVNLTKNGFTTALSHANIIIDLFNKCTHGGMRSAELKEVLIEQACQSTIDVASLQKNLHYKPVNPSEQVKIESINAHKIENKTYNANGNRFDLTVEELFTSIKWIVLQEDINYPMPRFLGRKMPFSRYLETLHVVDGGQHRLQEVIQRALAHYRPPLWPDMDYAFTQLIQ
ncbi:hypothetical protein [Spirosoma areae]